MFNNKTNKIEDLTKGPISGEHVGEVGNDVEGSVDDIRRGEVDDEVVGHRSHPLVGEDNPDYWNREERFRTTVFSSILRQFLENSKACCIEWNFIVRQILYTQ